MATSSHEKGLPLDKSFGEAIAKLPLVAILRGISPDESTPILTALIDAGFHLIEAPLNSPQPFETIRLMRAAAPREALIGAGTVRTLDEVAKVADAGGDIIVMPHADTKIIAFAKARGLIVLPGVATPTEAFAAASRQRRWRPISRRAPTVSASDRRSTSLATTPPKPRRTPPPLSPLGARSSRAPPKACRAFSHGR
jgi:hypothetical protein